MRIAYRLWDDPGAIGVPVVLHHGFVADTTTNWVAPGTVAALLDAGHRVWALDARGHGRSDKPHDPARYGEARMAVDLAELLDHLGTGEIDLVGYSMGAVVSLIFASTDPRVRRLAVGGVGAAIVELGGVDTRALSGGEMHEALHAADASSIHDRQARAFRRFADAVGADRIALAAQASRRHASPIAVERIRAPTLVLAGDADPLAARPEVLAGAIPGARLVIVAGHHFAAVGDPRFNAAIVEHLAPDD